MKILPCQVFPNWHLFPLDGICIEVGIYIYVRARACFGSQLSIMVYLKASWIRDDKYYKRIKKKSVMIRYSPPVTQIHTIIFVFVAKRHSNPIHGGSWPYWKSMFFSTKVVLLSASESVVININPQRRIFILNA